MGGGGSFSAGVDGENPYPQEGKAPLAFLPVFPQTGARGDSNAAVPLTHCFAFRGFSCLWSAAVREYYTETQETILKFQTLHCSEQCDELLCCPALSHPECDLPLCPAYLHCACFLPDSQVAAVLVIRLVWGPGHMPKTFITAREYTCFLALLLAVNLFLYLICKLNFIRGMHGHRGENVVYVGVADTPWRSQNIFPWIRGHCCTEHVQTAWIWLSHRMTLRSVSASEPQALSESWDEACPLHQMLMEI